MNSSYTQARSDRLCLSGGIFSALCLENRMTSIIGGICDLGHLQQAFQACGPEIVFHLAAQPLVRESYRDPAGTYSTNVLGTVNAGICPLFSQGTGHCRLHRPRWERDRRRGEAIYVRSPYSVRPYQHVLEPLGAYLLIVKAQYDAPALADLFCRCWGDGSRWTAAPDGGPGEAARLTLDCTRIAEMLGWTPRWRAEAAVEKAVEWMKAILSGQRADGVTRGQTEDYFGATSAPREQHAAEGRTTPAGAVLPAGLERCQWAMIINMRAPI
nr:GDP-mannose 4,6-dehydratase [uncultured Oscillibacter sp.]